jgi:hypothetical protein
VKRIYFLGALALLIIALLAGTSCSPDTPSVEVSSPEPGTLSVEITSPKDGDTLSRRALSVVGQVSNPSATVTVNGDSVTVATDGSFSANVLLVEGSNSIEAVATLDGEQDREIVTCIVSLEEKPVTVPGRSLLSRASLEHESSVELHRGETKSIDFKLETKENGPARFITSVHNSTGEYSESTIPMPDGLKVNVEPSEFIAHPKTVYLIKLTVETTVELAPGEYFLLFECQFEGISKTWGWIRVNVKSE